MIFDNDHYDGVGLCACAYRLYEAYGIRNLSWSPLKLTLVVFSEDLRIVVVLWPLGDDIY